MTKNNTSQMIDFLNLFIRSFKLFLIISLLHRFYFFLNCFQRERRQCFILQKLNLVYNGYYLCKYTIYFPIANIQIDVSLYCLRYIYLIAYITSDTRRHLHNVKLNIAPCPI